MVSEPSTSTAVTAVPVKPKEKIIFEAHPMTMPAMLTFENLGLFGILLVVGLAIPVAHLGLQEILIIGLIWAIVAFPTLQFFFTSSGTGYVLTNQRLVVFTPSLRKNETSIPLEEIQDAACKFSGLQRFYGAGDVIVRRKGLRKSIRLKALPNCKSYAKQINQAVKGTK